MRRSCLAAHPELLDQPAKKLVLLEEPPKLVAAILPGSAWLSAPWLTGGEHQAIWKCVFRCVPLCVMPSACRCGERLRMPGRAAGRRLSRNHFAPPLHVLAYQSISSCNGARCCEGRAREQARGAGEMRHNDCGCFFGHGDISVEANGRICPLLLNIRQSTAPFSRCLTARWLAKRGSTPQFHFSGSCARSSRHIALVSAFSARMSH